jgi:hypothetical protein
LRWTASGLADKPVMLSLGRAAEAMTTSLASPPWQPESGTRR